MDGTARRAVGVGVILVVVAILLATVGAGDGGGPSTAPGDGPAALVDAPDGTALAAGLRTVAGCDEFAATMSERTAASVDWRAAGPGPVIAMSSEADEESADAGVGAAGDDSAAAPVAGAGDATNVQVAGVDEPDVVEQLGDRLLVGAHGTLHVVTIDADAPVLRGAVALGDWTEVELMAVGTDRVVAIVRDGAAVPVRGPADTPDAPTVRPSWTTTSVVLVDVADVDAPRVVSRLDLEGSLVDARAVDGVVRVAVRGDGPRVDVGSMDDLEPRGHERDDVTVTDEAARAVEDAHREEYQRRVAEALASLRPTDWQPHVRVTAPDGTATVEPLVACDSIGLPTAFSGVGTLTIAAIDATGDELTIDGSTGIVASGEQLYATADRLVVATTRWEPCCEDVPVEQPPAEEPVEEPSFLDGDDEAAGDAPTDGATATARALPMLVEPGWWGRGGATDLHVFDVDGTIVDHVASGGVDGWLLNQFAMSIEDGVLRVATTSADDDGRTSSAVTTFRVEGDELVELGSVGDLGPDEDIQAVRFMGDVGYVVTFRRTDPLYVVDLSDPAAPRTLGELKIEGYSAQLHPLGDDLLLGVGQDADPETGTVRGVQVSTFDVSDPTTPTRIDVDVTPDSSSEAEWDHHALTVTADGRVFVPFQRYAVEDGREQLGALVYDVDDGGTLRDVGTLDVGARWELAPRRTVVGDDVVVTVGHRGLVGWDATTLEPTGTVELPEPRLAEG